MKKSRRRGLKRTNAGATLFGILFSAVAFLITALIFALISGATENPTGNIGLISLAAFLSGGVISGATTSRFKGEGGAIPSAISSLLFSLILLTVGLFAKGGELPLITIVNAGAYIAVSTFAAILFRKRERRRER